MNNKVNLMTVESLEKAVACAPEDYLAHLHLASICFREAVEKNSGPRKKLLNKAKKAAQEAIRLAGGEQHVWLLMADICLALGKEKQAAFYVVQASRASRETMADALWHVGFWMNNAKDRDAAITRMAALARLTDAQAPEAPLTNLMWSVVLNYQGEYDAADKRRWKAEEAIRAAGAQARE